MSVVIEDFRYLVVATGYTARLVKRVDELNEKFVEHLDEEERSNDSILYIHDDIWGGGLYPIDGDAADKIDSVRKAVEGKVHRAHIVLRCGNLAWAMGILEDLMNERYCACFSFTSMYKMEIVDGDILVMHF